MLPSWKVNLSGSISLKFRTNEKNGLLLYNGGGSGQDQVKNTVKTGVPISQAGFHPNLALQDYFAMELLDGHLHVHLDLGSGAAKIRASRFTLDDGSWHQVRRGRLYARCSQCVTGALLTGGADPEAQDGQDHHRRRHGGIRDAR